MSTIIENNKNIKNFKKFPGVLKFLLSIPLLEKQEVTVAQDQTKNEACAGAS